MQRQISLLLVSLVCVLVCFADAAWAVITAEFPLQKVIQEHSDHIFVAKVERVDPDRPAMVLTVSEQLKGKVSFERMPVNLKGDQESDKGKHTSKLLKRVAPGVEMIVFAHKEEDGQLMALAFTNGTWLQMLGYPDGKNYRWAFTHCEIYLRRTFRGTTDELKTVVTDVLKKKKRAPAYDPKVPPGFGPELEAKKEKQ